ncbi:MAG: histidinol dehydrogenase, partial [Vicinamibacteria bacterium]
MIRMYESADLYFRSRSVGEGAASSALLGRVAAILDRVRNEGDRALIELTRELDGVSLQPGELRVSGEEIARSAAAAPKEFRGVLSRAAENIRRYHERQIQEGYEIRDQDGSVVGQRIRPLESVGVYVPGGEASYPSTVLMNVIPAQIAGVERVVAVTPPSALERSAELSAALDLLGVSEVYRVGGAQAVGALAFGTESVQPVAKIVGPGNAYVAEAKRLVFGRVGIDAVSGPSEIVVLADGTADARYVAADLLSQA